jgi:hypothetical protein
MPGEASGDQVNEAIENQARLDAGLLPQRKAWFYDHDGTRQYHDLDVQEDGTPSPGVTVRHHKMSGPVVEQTYGYVRVEDGHLVYKETTALS